MMNNLVIGSSSQLARYFPDSYERISSRNIDFDGLSRGRWDSVYICFAEQRTYLASSKDTDTTNLFWNTNLDLTMQVIKAVMPSSRRVVFYSTAELWNNCNGPVDSSLPFDYHENLYTTTKNNVSRLLKNKDQFPNVSIVYPFNFNSIYRSGDYLFTRIFKSIVNKTKIEIGDVDFYREVLHPSMVVKRCIEKSDSVGEDYIVGSGRVIHVGDFIQKLYSYFDMDFTSMVSINATKPSIYRKNIFYSAEKTKEFFEDRLFDVTVAELTSVMENKHE